MRNSNKVMALAAAVIAIAAGHSFNFWYNTDPIAQAQHVDAKHVWELAQFKVIGKKSAEPDPQPEPPTPASAPVPTPKPTVKKFARLNDLGISNSRTYYTLAA